MPLSRTPLAKAKVTGAIANHPARFEGRKAPKRTRPIGKPYATMTKPQKDCWLEMSGDMPWLHSAHRTLLRLACVLAARLETDAEFGVSATTALSTLLSKLGATPVDETKVAHGDDDETQDPGEGFFGRPN